MEPQKTDSKVILIKDGKHIEMPASEFLRILEELKKDVKPRNDILL